MPPLREEEGQVVDDGAAARRYLLGDEGDQFRPGAESGGVCPDDVLVVAEKFEGRGPESSRLSVIDILRGVESLRPRADIGPEIVVLGFGRDGPIHLGELGGREVIDPEKGPLHGEGHDREFDPAPRHHAGLVQGLDEERVYPGVEGDRHARRAGGIELRVPRFYVGDVPSVPVTDDLTAVGIGIRDPSERDRGAGRVVPFEGIQQRPDEYHALEDRIADEERGPEGGRDAELADVPLSVEYRRQAVAIVLRLYREEIVFADRQFLVVADHRHAAVR